MAELAEVEGFDLEQDLEPEQAPEREVYWPLKKDREFVDELKNKKSEWESRAQEIGLWGIWRIAFCAFHGLDVNTGEHMTSRMGYAGTKGQLIQVSVNAYRSYMTQKTTLMIGERPAFKTLATNTDRASQTATELADTFIAYTYQRHAGDQLERAVGEVAQVLGGAYVHTYWDFDGGDDVDTVEQVPAEDGSVDAAGAPAMLDRKVKARSGAPKSVRVFPWDLYEEPEEGETYWRAIKEPNVNKHVLASAYPKYAEEILAGGGESGSEYFQLGLGAFMAGQSAPNKDKGTLHHFYHKRCKAIPDGLYVMVFADTEIYRGPLPVPEGLPISELKPSTFFTTKFPYAAGWDLIVIQAVINQLLSDEVSNFARFGRSNILTQKGTDMSVRQMADGGKMFQVPAGTTILPQYLLGGQSPAKSGDLREELKGLLQDISGLNAIARGDTKSSVTSGTMAALYKDTALEFMSADQADLDNLRQSVATTQLHLIQAYGQTPFLAEVAGVQERTFIREFTREEISGYKRVIVETSSPALRSIPGRLELMDRLAKFPPEQRGAVLEMVQSGSTDGFFNLDRSRDQRIRQENEDLQTGARPVQAAVTDPHTEELQEHRALLDRLRTSMDAETPDGQAAIARVVAHISDHKEKWIQSDPVLDKMLGIEDPPPLPGTPTAVFMAQLAMGAAGGAPPAPGPAGGSKGPGAVAEPSEDSATGPKAPASGPDQAPAAETGPGGVPLPKAAKAPPSPSMGV